MFTRAELEFIGGLCKKHNVIALMDEVYEWIVYDGLEHVRMASLPGMWESTITVGSAGKIKISILKILNFKKSFSKIESFYQMKFSHETIFLN